MRADDQHRLIGDVATERVAGLGRRLRIASADIAQSISPSAI